MFAYCGNNPANRADPSGLLPSCTFLGDNHLFSDKILSGGGGGVGITSPSTSKAASDKVIANEVAYFNNTDEQAVLDAEYFAFYKGTLVVKMQPMNNKGLSFGIIFLGPHVDAATVKHEYGHYLHLQEIGVQSYIINVAIPSLIDSWSNTPYSVYYSEPQEYIADILGGVSRTYENQPYEYSISSGQAMAYYIYTVLMGELYD